MTRILEWPTLVLNKNWNGINTVTVQKALTDVFADRAKIICPDTFTLHSLEEWLEITPMLNNGDPTVSTTRGPLAYPHIIVANNYSRIPRKKVIFSRKNLWRRDRFTCQYCGIRPAYDEITIDHLIPRSRGGESSFPNCVLACIKCNLKKRDRTPKEAGMSLRRRILGPDGKEMVEFYTIPSTPPWSPLYSVRRQKIPESALRSWSKFLKDTIDYIYWNTELET